MSNKRLQSSIVASSYASKTVRIVSVVNII